MTSAEWLALPENVRELIIRLFRKRDELMRRFASMQKEAGEICPIKDGLTPPAGAINDSQPDGFTTPEVNRRGSRRVAKQAQETKPCVDDSTDVTYRITKRLDERIGILGRKDIESQFLLHGITPNGNLVLFGIDESKCRGRVQFQRELPHYNENWPSLLYESWIAHFDPAQDLIHWSID